VPGAALGYRIETAQDINVLGMARTAIVDKRLGRGDSVVGECSAVPKLTLYGTVAFRLVESCGESTRLNDVLLTFAPIEPA